VGATGSTTTTTAGGVGATGSTTTTTSGP
jgi:hypothetical protein